MVGYDNLIFGGQIESSGGSDGILSGDKRLNPHEAKLNGVNGHANGVSNHEPVSSE